MYFFTRFKSVSILSASRILFNNSIETSLKISMSTLLPRKTSAYASKNEKNKTSKNCEMGSELNKLPGIDHFLAPGSQFHLLRRMSPEEQKNAISITHADYGDHPFSRGEFETQEMFAADFDRSRFAYSFDALALRIPQAACSELTKVCRNAKVSTQLRIKSIVSDVDSSLVPFPEENSKAMSAFQESAFSNTHRRLLLTPAFATNANIPLEHSEGVPKGVRVVSTQYVRDNILNGAEHAEFWNKFDAFLEIQRTSQQHSDAKPSEAKDVEMIDSKPIEETKRDVSTTSNSIYQINFVLHTITFTYEFFLLSQILRSLLPPEIVTPTGFAASGHIAHLNLRAPQLPYRKVIGEILLEKSANIKTVVNKLGTINNKYRNFAAEIIAGERNTITMVREQNAVLEFDFAQVYWNSRLSAEHERIVNLLKPQESVLDPFAGVGPFAIPAAIHGARVYANDLNPNSSRSMRRNAFLNRVDRVDTSLRNDKHNILLPDQRRLSVWNTDARLFIRAVARAQLEQIVLEKPRTARVPWFNYIVMNLPATAVQFLDAFRGLYSAPIDFFPGLPRELPLDDASFKTISKTQLKLLSNDIAGVPDCGTWHLDHRLTEEDTLVQRCDINAALGKDESKCEGFIETNQLEIPADLHSQGVSREYIVEQLLDKAEKANLAGHYFETKSNPFTQAEITSKCSDFTLPIIHCYCFTRDVEHPERDALRQCERYLNHEFKSYHAMLDEIEAFGGSILEKVLANNSKMPQSGGDQASRKLKPSQSPYARPDIFFSEIEKHGVYVHHVRNVAPHKIMMCVSFRLPEAVAFEDWSTASEWYSRLLRRASGEEQGEVHDSLDDSDEDGEMDFVEESSHQGESSKRLRQ